MFDFAPRAHSDDEAKVLDTHATELSVDRQGSLAN